MKRAAIYNPYLNTLGGGERYTLSFANVLVDSGYSVDLEWKNPNIISRLEKRFGMNLSKINVIPDVKKGDGYDLCFWVSDGSIPLMHARQNILHFQVPFQKVGGRSLLNKMKLFRVNTIVCNSQFTKKVIDKEFGVESIVINPPVDTSLFKSKRKENVILYVGRFSKILQGKGQDILITMFKKLKSKGITDWKLILAGGVEVGAGDWTNELRKSAKNSPVEIIESPGIKELTELYGKSKIFWSAAGFGQNEMTSPEKMEHFGITVVEAMSAGAVPIIYDGGGHKEIVEDGVNGYLWKKPSELINKTVSLTKDAKKLHHLERIAKIRADKFSNESFEKNIKSKILSW